MMDISITLLIIKVVLFLNYRIMWDELVTFPVFHLFIDPRNHMFLLLRSPMTVVMILAIYLLFVQKIGPQFMSNRKPYQLRSILLGYNLLQVFFNFYTATAGFYYSYWQPDFDYAGQNHYNGTTTSYILANICYFYFWTKIFDLFDTVFFVLRKKSNQISFLHLYHHGTMIFVEYIHNKYFAGMYEICWRDFFIAFHFKLWENGLLGTLSCVRDIFESMGCLIYNQLHTFRMECTPVYHIW